MNELAERLAHGSDGRSFVLATSSRGTFEFLGRRYLLRHAISFFEGAAHYMAVYSHAARRSLLLRALAIPAILVDLSIGSLGGSPPGRSFGARRVTFRERLPARLDGRRGIDKISRRHTRRRAISSARPRTRATERYISMVHPRIWIFAPSLAFALPRRDRSRKYPRSVSR